MIELFTKISLHLLIALMLKSIVILMFEYTGVQASTNDRPCQYFSDSTCTKIQ